MVLGNGSAENLINGDIADICEIAQNLDGHGRPAVLDVTDVARGYMKLCGYFILCQSLFYAQLFDRFTQTLKIKIVILNLAVCRLSVFFYIFRLRNTPSLR